MPPPSHARILGYMIDPSRGNYLIPRRNLKYLIMYVCMGDVPEGSLVEYHQNVPDVEWEPLPRAIRSDRRADQAIGMMNRGADRSFGWMSTSNSPAFTPLCKEKDSYGQRTGVGLYAMVVVSSGTEPSTIPFSCHTSVAASRLSSPSDSEKYVHMSTTVPGAFAGLNLEGRGGSPGPPVAAGCLGPIALKRPLAMYQKRTTAQCMGTGAV